MKISRITSVLFLLAVVAAGGAGCSLGRDTAAGSGNVAEGRSAADRTKEGRVKITVSVWDNANSPQFQAMADAFMEKNPEIDVELLDIQSDEYNNKLTVLLAGNESDPDVIMIKDADTQISMREKGQILDLTSYISRDGVDLSIYNGAADQLQMDGKQYTLPFRQDWYVLFYNKDLFDKANIPYPTAEDWTWEKFIEIGKKLTDETNGIYGAYNPDWVHYNYMYAMQKGFEHYKEDGTSNYDDPLFKESVEWYYGLGNTEKIQPSYLVQKSKQMPVDYFTTGKVGMSVCGGWTTNWLIDKEKYPRDWKAGVLPMPHPEGEEKSVSVVVSNVWIPTTSKNKEKAFEVAKLFAENQYTLGYGRIPARVDLTDEEIQSYIKEQILPTLEDDGITVEDIQKMWFDPNVDIFDEKPVGDASTDIKNIIVDECGLYGIGEQSLDDTVSHIKQKADEAIKAAKK